MSSFPFSEDFDSAHFSLLPSLSQDILSDDFHVEFPIIPDFNEDEENDLFQSCTDDLDAKEESVLAKEDSFEEENSRMDL